MAPERWDRDRFYYELDRDRDRDRHSEVRERFEEDDRTSVFTSSRVGRPGPRLREHSVDTERFERRFPSRGPDDDLVMRERRVIYDERDEPSPRWRRRPLSPPETEIDRRVVIEKERFRSPSPAPLRRPPVLRRQSSLDTFDRRRYYERDEYGPPARRGDYRAPPYVPIPLPRSRALPPPRVYDRDYYDEIQVSDPYYYGDDDFHAYPERMREKEIIRTKRRDRARSVRSVSSSSSSSSSTSVSTAKSEYPKKGKTRIPMRLVSKRALIDLGYPFVEEGNTIVIQKALGQQNIDEVLKLSEDYKKSELEIAVARSSAGDVLEERVEERREEVITTNGPAVIIPSAPLDGGPNIITVGDPPGASPVEVVNTTTIVRDISPARSHRSHRSRSTSVSHGPVIIDARPREISEEINVGPLALVERNHHHRPRSLSRGAYSVSTTSSDIRSEIRHLERELARRDHYRRDRRSGGELVRAERLSSGELVLFEEKVERIEEPSRGPRIEKDRKGPPPKLMKAMLATLT